MRLLAISGSLRAASTNTAVLNAALRLVPPGCNAAFYAGLGTLPLFNPDIDRAPFPEPVLELRRAVAEADALLICSPEYARGIAGALKNALDWLVSGEEFPGKAVGVVNASQRAVDADASLRLVLRTMSARLVEDACITLPLLGRGLDAGGIAADPAFSEPLRLAVEALLAAAGADARWGE